MFGAVRHFLSCEFQKICAAEPIGTIGILCRVRILVTGGCGFIGANFLLRYVAELPDAQFLNLDKLGYAGNPRSLVGIQDRKNYQFIKADLGDADATHQIVREFDPTHILHFAAETHVDRSIKSPRPFIESNVVGTFNLLEAARDCWNGQFEGRRFHHVSTDEVFGELGDEGAFTESTAYDPRSPYSASKASSDHLVRAWNQTFGLPITITNCSNNYGPYQFPEKLIPVVTLNAFEGKPIPVYGKGSNIRDWLHVGDHCEAIMQVVQHGRDGETYTVGGNAERTNLQVVEAICQAVAEIKGVDTQDILSLIEFVKDRPGHDFRYAIDASKIQNELGWQPRHTFGQGLVETVRWYYENPEWVESVKSGEYRRWVAKHYGAPA